MNIFSLKRFVKIFFFISIPFLFFSIIISQQVDKSHDDFFKSFNLVFRGVVIKKTDLNNHNNCNLVIKVNYSNRKEYSTKNELLSDYCILKNDTAYMVIQPSNCISIGDSILIGPNETITIKNGTDIIWSSNNNINNCTKRRKNKMN